jgi:hypothetical protein
MIPLICFFEDQPQHLMLKASTVSIGKRKFLLRSEIEKFKPSPAGRPKKKSAKKASKRTARPRKSATH